MADSSGNGVHAAGEGASSRAGGGAAAVAAAGSGNGAHTGGEGASSRAGGGAAAPGGGVEDARRAGQRPSSDGAVNALGLPDGIPILILSCVGVYIYLCDQSAYQRQDVYRHIYIYTCIYTTKTRLGV